MSTRLEYWDATPPSGNPRWMKATIYYGSATNNPVVHCDIVERLGRPRQAKVTLMNQGTAFNTIGPFTNEFTDFQRIRIIEDEFNIVLFHGRIYDISIHTDGKFGDVTTLECYDMLRELQEYPTEHMKDSIKHGTGTAQFNKNSILINKLIASDYASDSSANIDSESINFTDTDKFNTSAVTLDADIVPEYFINKGEKTVLAQVAAIARQDPHSGSVYEDQFGYDYYLDSRFDKTTDFIASTNATLRGDAFNYFKRGTRPLTPGTPGTDGVNWKGLRIHRPVASFTETGNLIPMMDGSKFDKPKDDLFTSVILQFDESTKVSTIGATFNELEALGLSNDFVQPQIAPHDGRFLVEGLDGGTFGGSNSGVFKWEGRKFSARYEVSVNADTADNVAAELIRYTHQHSAGDTTHGEESHGGAPNHIHTLGRVVYQSATTGTGLFLLTFEDKYEEKTFNYLCDQADAANSTLVLTGFYTNATYTFTPKTQRLKSKFGLQRPYRLKIGATNSLDSIRQEAANALSKSALPQLSGRFRTLRAPYYYVEMYASGSGDVNSITISHIRQNNGSFAAVDADNNPATWGIKRGMTIAKVDSNGTQTAWGWITNVSGTNDTQLGANIRNATHDGDEVWTNYYDSGNLIRVYIPVRTGHYTYVVNDAQAVNGYHFIEEVNYSETQGAIGTNFKSYGTNSSTYAYEGPYKSKLPEVLVAIDETSKNIGKLSDLPISMMPWQFTQSENSGETGKFTITGQTGVTWTSGILKVGGIYTYKIRGGNATLSTAKTGQVDGKPYEYIIAFDGDQTPDSNSTYALTFTARKDYIDDVDKIKLGWARAGNDTSDPLELSFSGSTSVGDFPIKNIGSALVRRGAQGFASDMNIVAASSAAHNKIQWAAFTIKFADQTTLSVNGSSDYNFGNHGSRTTYWMYVTIPASGAGSLDFADSYTTAFSDGKINLGTIVVEADSNSDLGNMPSVFPISSKEAVISAGLIHANALSALTATLGTITSGTIKLSDNDAGGLALSRFPSGNGYTSTDDLRALWNSGNGIYMSPAGIWGVGNVTQTLNGNQKYTAEWMAGSGASNSGNNKAANKGYIMAGAYPADGDREPTIKIGAQGIQLGNQNQVGAALQVGSHGIAHFANTANHPSIGVIGVGGAVDNVMRPPNTLAVALTYSTMQNSGNTLKNGLVKFQDQILSSSGMSAFNGYWGSGVVWGSNIDNSFNLNPVARAGITFQHKSQGNVSTSYHYASNSGGTPTRGRLEFISYSMDEDNSTAGTTTATDFYVGNKGAVNPVWQFAIDTDYTAKALKRVGSVAFTNGINKNSITIQVSSAPAAYTLNLPTAAPTAANQTLLSSGSGASQTLTWGTAGGGGSSYAGWAVSDGSNAEVIGSGHGLTFTGSNGITTSYSASSNTLTINGSGLATSGHSHGGGGSGHTHSTSLDVSVDDLILGGAGMIKLTGETGTQLVPHSHADYGGWNIRAATIEDGTSGSTVAEFRYRDDSGGSYRDNKVVGLAGFSTETYNLYVTGDAAKTVGGTDWINASDDRIKTNINTITSATDKLKSLNPVSFKYTDAYQAATGNKDIVHYGYLASNFGTLFPDFTYTTTQDVIQLADGSYEIGDFSPAMPDRPLPDGASIVTEDIKSIDTSAIVPYLVATIKELEARIAALES